MSVCIWLTGLSGSGKSTLARELALALRGAAVVLDGDVLRRGLSADLGYGIEDRGENVRRAAAVARLLLDSDVSAIVALISPCSEARARARQSIEPGTFLECFVSCPLEVCEARDPKGLYARARRGDLPGFTGIDAPYESPTRPDVVLHTDRDDVGACVQQILEALSSQG